MPDPKDNLNKMIEHLEAVFGDDGDPNTMRQQADAVNMQELKDGHAALVSENVQQYVNLCGFFEGTCEALERAHVGGGMLTVEDAEQKMVSAAREHAQRAMEMMRPDAAPDDMEEMKERAFRILTKPYILGYVEGLAKGACVFNELPPQLMEPLLVMAKQVCED